MSSLLVVTQVVLVIFSFRVEPIFFIINCYLYCLCLLLVSDLIYWRKSPINRNIQYTLIIDVNMFSHKTVFSSLGCWPFNHQINKKFFLVFSDIHFCNSTHMCISYACSNEALWGRNISPLPALNILSQFHKINLLLIVKTIMN